MFAAVLKVEDAYKIEGESILKGCEKAIDVKGFNHDVTLPMTADKSSNSRTAGRPNLNDLVVNTLLGKHYPKFLEACGDGKNLGKVSLAFLRTIDGGLKEIHRYELTDTFVSKVVIHGGIDAASTTEASPDDLHPMVSIHLNYASITSNYSEFDNAGKSKGAVSSKNISATAA